MNLSSNYYPLKSSHQKNLNFQDFGSNEAVYMDLKVWTYVCRQNTPKTPHSFTYRIDHSLK